MATVRQPISRLPLVTEINLDALIPMLENPDSEDKRTVSASVQTLLEETAESILFGVSVRIALFAQGVISGMLLRIHLPEPYVIPGGFSSSIATAGIAATAETIFTIEQNGVEIGTITFEAAGTEGVFSGSETEFAPEDILTVTGPVSADATLNQVSITIAAGRVE